MTRYVEESSQSAIGAKHVLESIEDVIDAVVDFANGDARPRLATRLKFIPKLGDERKLVRSITVNDDGSLYYPSISRKEADKLATEELRIESKECQSALLAFLRAKTKKEELQVLKEVHAKFGKHKDFGVAMHLAVHIEEDDSISTSFRAVGSAYYHGPWTVFAVSALAAENICVRDFYSHCHLPGCNRIFSIETETGLGRKRRKYCCQDHTEAAKNINAAERQRLSRERRREAAKKKTTRRKK